MSESLVLLHGAISNAGDFLIKEKAKALLTKFKPGANLIEIPRWEPLDARLDEINRANALLLCGGPAITPNLYPELFALTDDLDRITVPIVPMAVGWHSPYGDWKETWSHQFTKKSRKLLNRMEQSGVSGGVRDYQTMNALNHQGVHNVLMTGCSVWYDLETLQNKPVQDFSTTPVESVAFSFGVNMYRDGTFRKLTEDLISALLERYGDALTCLFHHPISQHKNERWVEWLSARNVKFEDISGSHEKMVDVYRRTDLHIGFRLHAHILMISMNKRSLLLSEDGRGAGFKFSAGGAVVDPIRTKLIRQRAFMKGPILRRVRRPRETSRETLDDMLQMLGHEERAGFPMAVAAHQAVRAHFPVMKSFISGLP